MDISLDGKIFPLIAQDPDIRYIDLDLPPPPPPPKILSVQGGATVKLLSYGDVSKSGRRVLPKEELSMKLVREYTNIPAPKPVWSKYRDGHGDILMTFIPEFL